MALTQVGINNKICLFFLFNTTNDTQLKFHWTHNISIRFNIFVLVSFHFSHSKKKNVQLSLFKTPHLFSINSNKRKFHSIVNFIHNSSYSFVKWFSCVPAISSISQIIKLFRFSKKRWRTLHSISLSAKHTGKWLNTENTEKKTVKEKKMWF